jgi:hypothetical protein
MSVVSIIAATVKSVTALFKASGALCACRSFSFLVFFTL